MIFIFIWIFMDDHNPSKVLRGPCSKSTSKSAFEGIRDLLFLVDSSKLFRSDFHIWSLKKMSGNSQQISPDFWKLSEIENFQSSNSRRFKTSFFTLPDVELFLERVVVFLGAEFQNCCPSRGTRSMEKEVDQCLAPPVQTHLRNE